MPRQGAANMRKYQPFTRQIGIDLQPGAGVDYTDDTSPA